MRWSRLLGERGSGLTVRSTPPGRIGRSALADRYVAHVHVVRCQTEHYRCVAHLKRPMRSGIRRIRARWIQNRCGPGRIFHGQTRRCEFENQRCVAGILLRTPKLHTLQRSARNVPTMRMAHVELPFLPHWSEPGSKLPVECFNIIEPSTHQSVNILLEAVHHALTSGFNGRAGCRRTNIAQLRSIRATRNQCEGSDRHQTPARTRCARGVTASGRGNSLSNRPPGHASVPMLSWRIYHARRNRAVAESDASK
jgi:hypothetical protein